MKKKIVKNIPNAISVFRLIFSFCLFFFSLYSPAFYVFYLLAGVSDVLDGYLARKTGNCTKIGSFLDSIGDLLLFAALAYLLLTHYSFPLGFFAGLIGVLTIKLATALISFLRFKSLGWVHSYLNKAMGIVLFVFPFLLLFLSLNMVCYFEISFAFLASIDEFLIAIFQKNYNSDEKGFLFLLKERKNKIY